MSQTGFVLDERFLNHRTGPSHPERPDRLRAIVTGLQLKRLNESLQWFPFEAANDDLLRLNHAQPYIERIEHACAAHDPYIDTPDSAICPASDAVARLAVGSVIAACDGIMSGEIKNAFCAVRPPGHHARHNRSAGFCLYNNIAIAARHLRTRHALARVAILDWDVHHGDGTQDSFDADPSVLFCSIHEDPRFCYPGSGFADEIGHGAGEGTIINIPMPPGADDDAYRAAFESQVLPRIADFAPEMLLVSNGLDAHAEDPLAGIHLSDEAFTWMMAQATALANSLCGGRLLVVLEGGYDLGVLSRCVPGQLQVLLES